MIRPAVAAAALGVPALFGVGLAIGAGQGDEAPTDGGPASVVTADPVGLVACPRPGEASVAEGVRGQVLWVTARTDDGTWLRASLDDGRAVWLPAGQVALDGDARDLPVDGCGTPGSPDGGGEAAAGSTSTTTPTPDVSGSTLPTSTTLPPGVPVPPPAPGAPPPPVPGGTPAPSPTAPAGSSTTRPAAPTTTVADGTGPQLDVSTTRAYLYTATGVPPCSQAQDVEVLVRASDPSGPVTVAPPTWSFTDSLGDPRDGVATPAGAGRWRVGNLVVDVLAGPTPIEIVVQATDGRGNESQATVEVMLRPSALECIG